MTRTDEDLDALKAKGVIRDYKIEYAGKKKWDTQTVSLTLNDGTVLEITASGSPSQGGYHDAECDGFLEISVEEPNLEHKDKP